MKTNTNPARPRLPLPARRWLRMAVLLLLIAPARPATAKTPPGAVIGPIADSLQLPAATAPLPAVRKPAPKHYAELRARRAFRYDRPAEWQLSPWDRFWAWFWEKVRQLLSTKAGAFTVKYGFYALVVAALTWAVLQLLRVNVTGVLGRSQVAPAYDVEAAETPFSEQLLARLLEAEAAADYRLATRLGYLLVLRHLTERELVRWVPDKTNQAYVRELAAGPVRDQFSELTRRFEVAWYGELPPTATEYATIRRLRDELLRALGAPGVAAAASTTTTASA